ncbi:hypothetical protein ES703_80451 [subsurface metagenome]
MNPAPAVAARNINTVAEGEIMMMDKELQRVLKEVSADIDRLSNSDRPLTKEEGKYRRRLLKRKYVLDSIKEAKEKHRRDDELFNSTVYEMLVPWGERHPFLMGLVTHLMRVKWASGIASVSLRESDSAKKEVTSAKRKEK